MAQLSQDQIEAGTKPTYVDPVVIHGKDGRSYDFPVVEQVITWRGDMLLELRRIARLLELIVGAEVGPGDV